MENIQLYLLCAVIILVAIVILLLYKTYQRVNTQEVSALSEKFKEAEERTADELRETRKELNENTQSSFRNLGETISVNQQRSAQLQNAQLTQLETRIQGFEATNEKKLEAMRETIEKRLAAIQEDNNKKLEAMRTTVDEKLQKTLDDKMSQSFRLVNESLEKVYAGLGEMQNLAVGVGDLKKVLSNVKTRGIVGEVQLGAILEEILAPEQYAINVATIPNSSNRVEYAVKLPGNDERPVYLPIDSKFPADAYMNLQEAYDHGSPEEITATFNVLCTRMKSFAKDIRDKYVEVPYTTDFAILFLPFEGLYAEAVNRGLTETLQREYHINVAGPSTMAALLNSLQMGFRTLAIEKRSSEVWEVLGAVKSEFDKFGTILSSTQAKLNAANQELDKLVGVRTRAIQRKLKNIDRMDGATNRVLELDEDEEETV